MKPLLGLLLLAPVPAAQVPLGQEQQEPLPIQPAPGAIPGVQRLQPGSGPVAGAAEPTPRLPVLLGMEAAAAAHDEKTLYLGERGPAGKAPGTERWIVTFWQRGFDLGEFRRCIHRGASADEMATLVAGLEERAQRDQTGFAAAVQQLGGTVTRAWWIVNGCALEIPRTALVVLAALPNVATLEPDREYAPERIPVGASTEPAISVSTFLATATNAQNHNADAVQAAGFRGANVGCAIMDTGLDSDMAGTGQPHRSWFRDGIKPGTSLLLLNRQMGAQAADDTHGHGTGVGGIAAGATWSSAGADFGHACNANKLNYSICDVAGSCNTFDATRVSAWQQIAADRAAFDIRTANNSYAGSPSPTNAVQQALDSVALNADVFIAVAAGNTGTSTTVSQAACNALAVAACEPTVKTIAGFSSRGPLAGDPNRSYPDITGCGVGTVMPARDNESANYINSGTSMASPQVCGAATLIRAAASLTALESKAVLLASAEDIASQNPGLDRNAYGMGFLRDDLAMELARTPANVVTDTLTHGASRYYDIHVTQGRTYAVCMTWHRVNFATTAYNDLDLYIRRGGSGGPVVSGGIANGTRNLYEMCRFVAPITGNLTIQVNGFTVSSPATETFAVAHTALTALQHPRPDGHVAPAAEAGWMSEGNNNIPFAWTPTRYQQVFLGDEVARSPVHIRKLALRQDEQSGGQAGQTIHLEIRLAHTTATPATIGGTFAGNCNAGAPVTVFGPADVALPPMPAGNSNPAEFFLEIPFATQFTFVPAPGRNLLVEVIQRGNSNGNSAFPYPLDAVVSSASTARVFGADTATTGTVERGRGLVMCFDGPDACPIVPANARAALGNADNAIPFAWTPTRYQQVFRASELGGPETFVGLGLRQDNAYGGQAGALVDLELLLGHTALDETTLTSTFDLNVSGARTVVAPRQRFVLPDLPPVGNTDPKRFLFRIPFARPFGYDGTSNVLVEILQRGNSRGNASFSYPLDAQVGPGTATTRLFGFPDTAATGTLGRNQGLVMCFDTVTAAVPGTYDYFGAGCAGSGHAASATILPAAAAAAMTNSDNRYPFGAAPQKYQQVFLGSEAPLPQTFHALGLRHDDQSVGQDGYAVDLQIELGYTTRTPATLGAAFAANYDTGTPVTVLSRQILQLPDMPAAPNADPASFFCRIPFSAPFSHVPAAGRNLLIQVTNRGNHNGNQDFNYPLDAISGGGTTRLFAPGDPDAATGTLGAGYGLVMSFLSAGGSGAVPQLQAAGDPVLGNTMRVDLWQARPGSAGILLLGLSNVSWSGIPLPLPLASVGAPGCSLLVSGEVILAAGIDAAGFASCPLSVPGDPSLVGSVFFNQFAVFDPGVNGPGLSWTNAGRGRIGNF